LHHVLEMHPEDHREQHPAHPATTMAVPSGSRLLVGLALLVTILAIGVGAVLLWPEAPDDGPPAPASDSPPATVELRLISSTAVPIPSPAASPLSTQAPSPRRRRSRRRRRCRLAAPMPSFAFRSPATRRAPPARRIERISRVRA
jgi:hypothetical protein